MTHSDAGPLHIPPIVLWPPPPPPPPPPVQVTDDDDVLPWQRLEVGGSTGRWAEASRWAAWEGSAERTHHPRLWKEQEGAECVWEGVGVGEWSPLLPAASLGSALFRLLFLPSFVFLLCCRMRPKHSRSRGFFSLCARIQLWQLLLVWKSDFSKQLFFFTRTCDIKGLLRQKKQWQVAQNMDGRMFLFYWKSGSRNIQLKIPILAEAVKRRRTHRKVNEMKPSEAPAACNTEIWRILWKILNVHVWTP